MDVLCVGVDAAEVVPVISVLDTTVNEAAGEVPKVTADTSGEAPDMKPVPVIVKCVPPAGVPDVGLIEATVAVVAPWAAAHRLSARPGPVADGAGVSSGEPSPDAR